MNDLLDFLVWVQREFKAGRTPVQMRDHIAYLVFEFLKQEEEKEISG